MTSATRNHTQRLTSALAVLALLYGAARFGLSAIWPACHALAGDFAAVFPSPYLARLRPDFPTNQVWDGGWYSGPMLHLVTLPLFALPRWWMVPPAWALTNLAALTVSFVCLCKLSGVRQRLTWPTVVALVAAWCLFQPLGTAFASGNIELLEMAFILVAVVGLESRRDGMSGALLGAATTLKFLPIGFLAWCLLRRRWRAVVMGALTIGLVLALTAATLGWKESALAAAMGSPTGWSNAGLHELSVTSMFLHRVGVFDAIEPALRWFPSSRADVAAWAGQIASALLAAGVACLLLLRRNRAISPWEVSALFLVMFIAVPRNHDYYYVFALVPISIIWLRAVDRREWASAMWMGAAYLLISPPIPFSWIDRTHLFNAPFAYVVNVHDLPVWGGLTLWWVVTARLWRDEEAETGGGPVSVRQLAAIGVAVLTIAAGFAWSTRPDRMQASSSAVALRPLVRGEYRQALAISVDGTRVAYVASSGELCTRWLSATDAVCWAATAGARSPFFSPDGRAIAFFVDDDLRKISVDDGATQVLAKAPGGTSGHWRVNRLMSATAGRSVIVFAASDGIHRIDDDGKETLMVRRSGDEGTLTSPELLPSGETLVFVVESPSHTATPDIVGLSMSTGRRQRLVSGRQPHFDEATGRLIFVDAARIMSIALHAETLTVGEVAEPLAPSVMIASDGAAQFAVSEDGTLVYLSGQPGPVVRRALLMVDRHGVSRRLSIASDDFAGPRFSPDGQRIAVSTSGALSDSWVFNVSGGTPTRVNATGAAGVTPVWMPDGRALAMSSDGPLVLSMAMDTASAEPQVLWQSPRASGVGPLWLGAWSRDGRWLVGATGQRLWLLDATAPPESGARAIWFDSAFRERDPVLSPDGEWLAYVADDAGGSAVYARPTFGPGTPRRVSADGGTEPVWSADGRELIFRQGDAFMSAGISGPNRVAAPPQLMFRGPYAVGLGRGRNFDVAPDGQHLLVVSAPEPEAYAGDLQIVRRWSATLRR